jgi:hypothetical protein
MRRVSVFLRRYLPLILAVLGLLAVVVVVWIFSTPIAPWLRSAQSFEAVAFLREHLYAVGLLGACLLVLMLIWLPKWQASSVQDMKDRLTVENDARQTLAQMVGGAVLIAGLFFTWANLNTATKTQEIAREGQITDRFTKAIAQLGGQGAVRLGGIYALERIAKDSEKDHWPIMEVLTAYVREHAPLRPEDKQTPIRADIQAILTVLGRRTRTIGEGKDQLLRKGEDQRLNLMSTNLRGADFSGAHLERANLWGAQLQEADLRGAQLQRAVLRDAPLQGAKLQKAQLQGADLGGAQLQQAQLQGAQLQQAILLEAQLQFAILQDARLQGATLQKAQLQGADLRGAQLQGANLLEALDSTIDQLSTVKTLYQADLDPSLLAQIRQQYPQLLEKPSE